MMTDSGIAIEMQDFKAKSVEIIQEENQNLLFDRKNMHRSTSQRQAKKVHIPCVPTLGDAAIAEEINMNIKNNNNGNNNNSNTNVCESMTDGRLPIFNYWSSMSTTMLNNSNMTALVSKFRSEKLQL
uniref:Uncharacterized protein n=1 Tax=Romanomermis culicivorax TaxID=13658 RepID=A0A915JWK0_ROMCU